MFVPDEVISGALSWLVRRQRNDGIFVASEESTSPSAANVTAATNFNVSSVTARRNSPLALTAHVLLAILQVEVGLPGQPPLLLVDQFNVNWSSLQMACFVFITPQCILTE